VQCKSSLDERAVTCAMKKGKCCQGLMINNPLRRVGLVKSVATSEPEPMTATTHSDTGSGGFRWLRQKFRRRRRASNFHLEFECYNTTVGSGVGKLLFH